MVKIRDLIQCRDQDQDQVQTVTVQMDRINGRHPSRRCTIGGGQHLNPLLNLHHGGNRKNPLDGRPRRVENDMYISSDYCVHEKQSPFDCPVLSFPFCVSMSAKRPTHSPTEAPTPTPTDFPSYVPTEPPTLQPTPRPS